MIKKIVSIGGDEVRLSGNLFLPDMGDRGPYPVVCLCHGIPDQPPDPTDLGYYALVEQICDQGMGAMFFNFRGTGASTGNLDILGWTRDLQEVLYYLSVIPEPDKSRISLLGFSAGASVAVYVAAQDAKISAVATCACPTEHNFVDEYDPQSIVDYFRSIGIIREQGFPPSLDDWLNGFRQVGPIKHIAKIAPTPILLVHGSEDKVVDVSQAHKLYEAAGEPKQLSIIDGAEHKLRQDDRAMSLVIDWLKCQAG